MKNFVNRVTGVFNGSALVLAALLLTTSVVNALNLYTYTNAGTTGDWNDPATWTTDPTGATSAGSAVPGANDLVTILNGFTVELTANVTTTGLRIVINNGGTLDLRNYTFGTLSALSGSGTIKIRSGYFPTVTSNAFVNSAASGATVNYYDFSGNIPTHLNYPNLTFSNSTGSGHTISFANASSATLSILGNLTTINTGSANLAVRLGSQAGAALTLNVDGNVSVGEGSTFGAGIFDVIHTMNVGGNMINNGTVMFSNATQYTASASGAVRLTFTGATDKFLSCQGPTNLYTLTIDKGVGDASVLSVTSTDVSHFKLYSNGQLITILRGTLRLGANINIPRIYGTGSANYDLGSPTLSPMLWIDGATVNTNGSALVAYGKFRMTDGSFTTLGGQGCVIREEGQYIIEGGTFTTEKFRPSSTSATHRGTFIMSGGVFNAIGTTHSDGNYARFSLPYPEQVFIMSGGTINIRNSQTATGALHIGSNEASHNITGGTINVILSGTAANFPLLSTAPLWNLTIRRIAGEGATAVTLANIGSLSGAQNTAHPLVVQNDFVIEGANAARFISNDRNVTIGGDFIVESGGTYTPGNNTTTFDGSADQLFDISGTVTGGLNNMSVIKPSGTVTLTGTSSSLIVRGTLSLFDGILSDGGKTIHARAAVHNESVHTGTGNITLDGAATQTISGDGTGVFGSIVLNNNRTPGAVLTSDATISGTLILAGTGNSLFDIGPYQLWLTSPSSTALTTTGAGFSDSKMVRTQGLQSDRGLKKSFGNLSAFTFHFGSGNEYMPATVQLTSAPAAYGAISVKPVNSRHPFVVASDTRNLEYYWKIVSEGFSGIVPGSVRHQFKYLPSKVSPAGDDANYIPARYAAGEWSIINDLTGVDQTLQNILFTDVDYLEGDFTAGVPSAFSVVEVYYSIRSGAWSDADPATTPWSNTSHTGAPAGSSPGPNDQVIIGDGATHNHTITVTSNGMSTGSISIASGSALDIGATTGHDFGRFETNAPTSGLLRISSNAAVAEFPAGDFGLFIRQSGGSVEYYSTTGQSFRIPSTSRAPTQLPLISYRHLILTPAAGTVITMPNQDLKIMGNMTVQGVASNSRVDLNFSSPTTLQVEGNVMVTGGNLQFPNGTPQELVVGGNISISANATWDVAASGTAAGHTLTVTGNLVNNGTLDFSKSGGRVCNTTFVGAANTSITGSGTTTDFNILTVNKGSNQSSILNVNASAFSLSGGNLPLELLHGTFRLSSAQTVTLANAAIFNIPAAARLSANGGTLQLTGNNGVDMRLAGSLEILSGTINIGTTAHDNSLEYAAIGTPSITISGGTLRVNSQIRRSTASSQGVLSYNQSGNSTVTVGLRSALSATRGVFEILNAGSSFTMTGGTLRVIRPTTGSSMADLHLHPTSFAVSGGTIEIGVAETSQIVDINSTIPLYNLSVQGTDNGARLVTNPLTLRGSLSITGDNHFDTNGLNVAIAGNLNNANPSPSTTLNTGGYRPRTVSQVTTLNGSTSNQTLSGTVGNLTVFSNLIINNTFSGGVIQLQANTAVRVSGSLTLSRGTLHDGGNAITVHGNISNSSVHASTGSGNISVAGSSGQFIGGNGSGRFGNLMIINGSGATLSANQEITGVLTLQSGSLFINQFTLYISNTSLSAISGASPTQYIVTSGQLSNGGLRKAFENNVTNGSFVYPIGVTGKYTPATYTITTGVNGGTITVKPVNSKHPGATGTGTSFVEYYWSVTNSVIVLNALTHTYQYAATGARGTPAEYRDARFKAGSWTIGSTAGNPDPLTRIITFTNTDVAGDYTAGEPTAFVNPTTYISIASGDWESDTDVWDQDPPSTNVGPPPGSFVIISEGHTVTVNTSNKQPATLDVRGRLHLGTTTGHNFGAVSATGTGERTIQLQSSIFPAGDFTNFVSANGGTVEYHGAVALPTQHTYNNLLFTGAGTKVMPNADLTINGSLTIQSGTVNNSFYSRNIVLVSNSHDFVNNGIFNAGGGVLMVARNLLNSGATTSFIAPTGSISGVTVGGNLTNTAGANFAGGGDNITVGGNMVNHSSFQVAGGVLNIDGDLVNSGSFASGAGGVVVDGSLTTSGIYQAGIGPTVVGANFINSGSGAVYSANANALTITGAFRNIGGATFHANTGSITLRGDWLNASTFNRGTGRVSFAGAGAQSLTGNTTFYNVSRLNGGTLTLNNSITIENLLSLVNGRVVTGSNVVALTNANAQPVTSFGPSAFIDGRVSIRFPNTSSVGRTFPVGKGTTFRPMTIYQGGVSSDPVVRVEMLNTPPTGVYPATIQGLSEARYYSVDLVAGTMNSPVVELSFNTNAPVDENIAIAGNARIVRATSPAGPWSDEGGSGVFSPAAPAGYATSDLTSLGNPTYFALAYQNVPLPITLGNFDARSDEGAVFLSWTTHQEINNEYFTIERSASGLIYDSILTVPGAGNSRVLLRYSAIDMSPLPEVSYYRLKQTDYDGKFAYSDVVRVMNERGLAWSMSIYPNPASANDEVFLKMRNTGDKKSQLAIASVTGQVYFEGVVDSDVPFNLSAAIGTAISKGIYIIRCTSNGLQQTGKLIVY